MFNDKREDPPAEDHVHVQRQEKILQRSIKYMFNDKREDPPAEHQVHDQRLEKILQRSIKYMFNGKRRSSTVASSTCSTTREDPPA